MIGTWGGATRDAVPWDGDTPYPVSGTAALVLTPSGTATRARPGAGTATLVLTASGSAARARPGAGTASLVLTPSGAATGLHGASGTGALVLTPSGSAVRLLPRSGAVTLILTPTGATAESHRVGGAADLILTPSGTAVRSLPRAGSVLLILHPADATIGKRGASGTVQIVFRARGSLKIPEVVFGESYLGRFQAGQEITLRVLVRDLHGAPALPTSAPVASLYALDADSTPAHVVDVMLPHLRRARNPALFAGPLKLGGTLPAGRYAVVLRYAVGAFLGLETATFEVDEGGDAAGPAVAGQYVAFPGADTLLLQLGSGALATGRRPRT